MRNEIENTYLLNDKTHIEMLIEAEDELTFEINNCSVLNDKQKQKIFWLRALKEKNHRSFNQQRENLYQSQKKKFLKKIRASETFSRPSKKAAKDFYESREWMALRYQVIQKYGRECMACGATAGMMHVDHIKPRSKYPELALNFNNLQVLCRDCNLGKGNWDETDWRGK